MQTRCLDATSCGEIVVLSHGDDLLSPHLHADQCSIGTNIRRIVKLATLATYWGITTRLETSMRSFHKSPSSNTTEMPPFTVSPATVADLPDIANISRAAFKDSPHTMSYWMFKQDNEGGIYKWRLRDIEDRFHNDPNCSYIRCVDTVAGKTVAFALWESPHLPKTEEQRAKEEHDKRERGSQYESLPEGTNIILLNEFEAETARMRSKYVNSEEDYGA